MLKGYTPGVVSLNERSQLKPENFNPDNFDFTNVCKVEILGPWNSSDKNVWTKTKVLVSDKLQKFLSVLKALKQHNGEIENMNSQLKTEYMIILYYSDGPVIRFRFFKDKNKLTLNNKQNWYCNTDNAFAKYFTL